MKSSRLRLISVLAVIVIVFIGFTINYSIGTVSAIGWQDIALLCPLGALGTMLASKLLVPKALISLAVAVGLIVLFGKAFCAWICPVPLVSKVRDIFKKTPAKTTSSEESLSAEGVVINPLDDNTTLIENGLSPLTADEKSTLAKSGCSSCVEKRGAIDSRHFILGGSLLSALIFGFPVFCLICPIGLSFATILLVVRLFSAGDITWSLILVPLLLTCEVVLFRKWCSKLCPLAALLSLTSKLNKTFRPKINDGKCIETAQGRACGICGQVCPEGIDPRHPEDSNSQMCECSKCRECVDACPSKALKMPFLPNSAGLTPKKPDTGEEKAA